MDETKKQRSALLFRAEVTSPGMLIPDLLTQCEELISQNKAQAFNRLVRQKELFELRLQTIQEEESDLLLLTSQKQDVQQEIVDSERTLTFLQQEVAENKVRSQQIVTAPFDGIVTGLNIQIGQQVTLNYLMVSLLPKDRNLQAHIYVPPHQVGFIEPNQKVMLQYASFPYQKFGMGKGNQYCSPPYSIHELQPHIVSLLQGQGAQGTDGIYYLVTVELDAQDIRIYGNDQKLMPGMLFEADILQDKRRIYEWIIEPVYSITKKQL